MTHHLIIRWLIKKLKLKGKLLYGVLGDDVVIFDKQLATHYLDVMERLGVRINLQKSTVWTPDQSYIPHCEIAKRLVTSYGDISPISYKLLRLFSQKPVDAGLVLRNGLEARGYCPSSSFWESLSSILSLKGKDKTKFLVLTTSPPWVLDNTRADMIQPLTRVGSY